MQPVISCGGSGPRIWMLSRAGFPKQLLYVTGNEVVLQQVAKRLIGSAKEKLLLDWTSRYTFSYLFASN